MKLNNLYFELAQDSKNIYYCMSNKSHCTLGIIKYNSSIKQYLFYPTNDTIFSKNYIDEILWFMEYLEETGK